MVGWVLQVSRYTSSFYWSCIFILSADLCYLFIFIKCGYTYMVPSFKAQCYLFPVVKKRKKKSTHDLLLSAMCKLIIVPFVSHGMSYWLILNASSWCWESELIENVTSASFECGFFPFMPSAWINLCYPKAVLSFKSDCLSSMQVWLWLDGLRHCDWFFLFVFFCFERSPQGSLLNVCCLCLSFLGGSLQVTIQKPITWKMAALSQAFTTSRYVSFYFLGFLIIKVTKQSEWISNIVTFSSMLPAQQLIWMLTFCETLPLDRLCFAVLILGSVRK